MLAALCGSAVNQDGQSSGLTAPNGPSQTKLIQSAVQHARLTPRDLKFVATHGTGTPLGDPIEVGAIGQALQGGNPVHTAMLTLASIKSCYGHTEGAAGITGLFMVAQITSRHCVSPSMHLNSVNAYIEAALTDWQMNGQLAASMPRQRRAAQHGATIAGTSSFGMSGVNAHVLLKSPDAQLLQQAVNGANDKVLLRCQQMWPLPMQHIVLLRAIASLAKRQALFHCALSRPSVHWLWGHAAKTKQSLPVAAVLEIMTAASSCLTGATLRQGLGSMVLATPAVRAADVSVSIGLDSGLIYVEADAQQTAESAVCKVDVADGSSVIAHAPSNTAAFNLVISHLRMPHNQNNCASLSSQLDEKAASCAPWKEAAVSLMCATTHSEVLGCEMYVPAARPVGKVLSAAASASRKTARLLGGTNMTACELHGLLLRPARQSPTSRRAQEARTPAWQLAWRPVDISLLHCVTSVLVISTHPSPLSSVCDFTQRSCVAPAFAALNAVFMQNCITACSSSVRAEQCCPELSFSIEAHLELLLQALKSHQHCVFLQPPGRAVDVQAALLSYRTVARSSAPVRLSLMTHCQHIFDGFWATRNAELALMQGNIRIAVRRTC
jgi:hypothetical protein